VCVASGWETASDVTYVDPNFLFTYPAAQFLLCQVTVDIEIQSTLQFAEKMVGVLKGSAVREKVLLCLRAKFVVFAVLYNSPDRIWSAAIIG
jgi:hypothetical protein